MIRVLAIAVCAFVSGAVVVAANGAEVVTYPAPADERQDMPYQVWAGDRVVDVYAARTLDPRFAGKEWDFGGPYCFANFDMSACVIVKITSTRSLRHTVVRPVSADVKPELLV